MTKINRFTKTYVSGTSFSVSLVAIELKDK